jgi:hypothetical protein
MKIKRQSPQARIVEFSLEQPAFGQIRSRLARISNSLRSLSPSMIFTAGPRAISTSESRRQGEGITTLWL